jgi:pimeloyl-ACP methyl ester carboxylesterase
VIFLKGENSEYLDQGDYTRILKLFPAAEFRIVKNAGHWIHADNPEAVAEALGDLMK